MKYTRCLLALVFCLCFLPGNAEAVHGPEFEISGSTLNRYNGNAAEVTVPDGITYINKGAFSAKTTLKKVTLPDSVKVIYARAFEECSNLTEVVMGSRITEIQESAFINCGKLSRVALPDSVEKLGAKIFQNCTALTEVGLPAGIRGIPNSAFSGCTGLTRIVIPEGVFSVADEAFLGCTSLRTVEMPQSLGTIGSRAFQDCEVLTGVALPNMLTYLGSHAFADCKSLTGIEVPKGVTILQQGVFGNCTGLTRVTLGNQVTKICDSAFKQCVRLSSIDLPDSLSIIERYAFSGSGLTSVKLPDGVTSLGDCVFNHCSLLEEADLGGGSFTCIGASALATADTFGQHGPKEGPSVLRAVWIPASVQIIESNAFEDSDRLTDVYFGGTREQWEAIRIAEYGNEALSRATIHFSEKPVEEWWPGTPDGCGWRWNPNNKKLSVLGFSISSTDPVLVACYDARGRMLSVQPLTSLGSSVSLAGGTKTVKLFYLYYNTPRYVACEIDAAKLT